MAVPPDLPTPPSPEQKPLSPSPEDDAPSPTVDPAQGKLLNHALIAHFVLGAGLPLMAATGIISPAPGFERYMLILVMAFCMSFVFYAFHPRNQALQGTIPATELLLRVSGPVVIWLVVFWVGHHFMPSDLVSICKFNFKKPEPGIRALQLTSSNREVTVGTIVENDSLAGMVAKFPPDVKEAEFTLTYEIDPDRWEYVFKASPGQNQNNIIVKWKKVNE
jgi:hypothetical protein